jgi:rare lipoprotein A
LTQAEPRGRCEPHLSLRRGAVLALGCLLLANCAASDKFARTVDPRYGVAASPRVIEDGQPVPKGGGVYRVGKPYVVAGRVYVPEPDASYSAEGLASWYGDSFHGRRTANGEVFDQDAISAAHPTLPIPSYARVTNLANRRSIIVRVNDRGPYHGDRVIDVSARTADVLGFRDNGVARVRVDYIGPAQLEGSDDRKLLATLRRDGQPAPAPSVLLASADNSFIPVAASPLPVRTGAYIPNPPDRPFELGRYPASPARDARQGRPTEIAAVSAPEARNAPAVYQRASFVPAAAPVSGVGGASFSGRGLY